MQTNQITRKTLGLARHSGSWVTGSLHRRYLSHYHGKHAYPKIIFGIDLVLFGMVIGTLVSATILILFGPAGVIDQVDFSATVAPAEVRSGSPSTLLIEWRSRATEELRDATVTLSYPDHFLVQNLRYGGVETDQNTLLVGTIPPGSSGTVKIRGVMFGDVGGEQSFTTTLSGRYGKWNRRSEKSVTHTFTPTASALAISDTLPILLVSGQEIYGIVAVKNTSTVDFGAVTIRSRRTDMNFTAQDGGVSTRQENGTVAWTLSSLKGGEGKTLRIKGRAPDREQETTEQWGFEAAFAFGDSTYAQGRTEHDFRLIPSPLSAELHTDHTFVNPGSDIPLTATFKNISDNTLQNISYFLEATSPFFAARDGSVARYDKKNGRWDVGEQLPKNLAPGEEALTDIRLPVRASIPISSTKTYERFVAAIQSGATFRVDKDGGIEADVRSRRVDLPITSPATLSSFGRYATAQGDQLGRGPLPPSAGEETRYWVFWNISGVTNPLSDVTVEGALPPYARFTGKQTVSLGSIIKREDGYIVWDVGNMDPNFAPGSRRIGAAFEIGVTPNEAHVGRPLTILDDMAFTARDAITGEVVQAFGARVTTNLPEDVMASGLGNVSPAIETVP